MNNLKRRALHFVLKIGNRKSNYDFFVKILGMKILRHEEFEEGCKATCNGPYDGRWSKTMIGYGAEDDHFVLELTYNYGIRKYERGNDFKAIVIHSSKAFAAFNGVNYIQRRIDENTISTVSPDGYPFIIVNLDKKDPVFRITLASADIERSIIFWSEKLEMDVVERTFTGVVLSYGSGQCQLEFLQADNLPLNHAESYGRIAFSCPRDQLLAIENAVTSSMGTIINNLVALDTPGKATVEVVILADPDGHEICFVGDEAFRELSKVDSIADKLLLDAMEADKSDDWLSKPRLQ